MRGRVLGSICAAAAVVVGLACTDATDVELLQINASGVVSGRAYIDMNGTRLPDEGDEPLSDVTVLLSSTSDMSPVATVQSQGDGEFIFEDVPVGRYVVRLDSMVLGDSLVTLGPERGVEVTRGTSTEAILGLSYPVLTVEEVRAAAPGTRVFTSGIALNTRRTFSEDHRIFIEGATAYLQATNVPYTNPPIAAGDSVRFLGRTGSQAGQPILDEVTPIILLGQARVTQPREVSTAAAADADGGDLDAALVRIRRAEIRDTLTSDNDFSFTANDGSGPVRVIVRSFLGRSLSDLGPTTIRLEQAVGLLSPEDDGSGNVRWRLVVRSAGELVTETRRADLSVSASFEPASASEGDVVDLRIVITNSGPLAANGVEVSDTLAAGLSRVSSTASQGAYSSAGSAGRWTLDRIEPGASDTLTVNVEVTGSGSGSASYVARIGGSDTEVDPDGGNNRATSSLTLIAPWF